MFLWLILAGCRALPCYILIKSVYCYPWWGQSHLHISLAKIMYVFTHGDKLAHISRLLGTAWMNAVIYFNNLPDGTGLLNDFVTLFSLYPSLCTSSLSPNPIRQPPAKGTRISFLSMRRSWKCWQWRISWRKWEGSRQKMEESPWPCCFQLGASRSLYTYSLFFWPFCRVLFLVGGDFKRIKKMLKAEPRAQRPGNRVGMRWKQRSCLSQNFKLGLI